MKAALWLRVSTSEQDLEKDRVALHAFAAGLGITDIAREYAHGARGASASRLRVVPAARLVEARSGWN